MQRYRVAQVGVGHRGQIHADAFLALSDRFDLVGLCDLDESKLRDYATSRGIAADRLYTDAETMLRETRPEVFCFVTQPTLRLPLVELAAQYEVQGLAFEKPMARSLREAWQIREICRQHRIKAVVSHQQKYLTSLQKVKQILDAGEIGDLVEIHSSSTGGLTDLGTHFTDYMLWANGGRRARWVVAHVHGTEQLAASHPSTDFFLARLEFENGVRGLLEIGSLAPRHIENAPVWLDNRLTVYGTHGYAWGDTDGRWEALTRTSRGDVWTGVGPGYDPQRPGSGWHTQQRDRIQIPYLRDLATWLDDEAQGHPCNVEQAYHGFEILSAGCLSALEHRRVDLPLSESEIAADVFTRLRQAWG